MPNSDAYKSATCTASLRLKVVVSFLLSIMVALFVGQALKAFHVVGDEINKRMAVNRLARD
jgi:hypothetical protein